MYSLAPNVALDVHYRDEEDDVITLNTDSELDDVLAMHALLKQLAPVKFEVFAKDDEDASLSSSIISTSTSATGTSSVIPSQVAPWRLTLESTPPEYSPVARHLNDRRRTIYGSEQSDDVSLIDLEDEIHTPHDIEEPITYPQHDLEVAALREEMQRLEAFKIEAPVFTSSIMGARQEVEEEEEDEGLEKVEKVKEAEEIQQVQEVQEVEVEEFEDSTQEDAPQPGSVAAAVEHYETLATRSQKSQISPSPLMDFEGEIVASTTEETKEIREESDVQYPEPSTASTSTSTTDRPFEDEDRALMEQFQLLIKEFQEIIQNNPQLVTLAGNIMNKAC